nr:hypothetical protein [Tanacetum cinerariifolium]
MCDSAEPGTSTSFLKFLAIKQLAIKRWNEYGFAIHPGLVGATCKSVRRMIAEPGDAERDVNVNETFHEQTDDKLSEKELKQIKADDQAIQTILLGLPEDIYAAV